MSSKKLILFIVEGITDQTCIGLVLDKLLSDHKVRFELTNGDVTTETGNNCTNISLKIGDIVNRFRHTFGLQPKDFLEVVHLVDMDGAYISESNIVFKDTEKLVYTSNSILTNKVDDIKQRNLQKKAILNRLITLNTVCRTIPYSVYFFSCNLDHVLHNQPNLNNDEKMEYANRFEDRYISCPEKFVEFLENQTFTASGDYRNTWEFIKMNNNSLNRFSNFHLYFSNPKNLRR